MIIPAIDLIGGKVVRLKQGNFNHVTPFAVEPLAQLTLYQNAGSELLHLVDLDGAKDPADRQLALISQLTEQLNAPLQVGGGVRSEQDVANLLESGVSKVVIGSMAVSQPELVAQWLQRYGAEHITLALDVRLNEHDQPQVLTHGWQQGSDQALAEVIAPMLEAGLRHVLCTDVDRDGMLTGPNINLYQALIATYPTVRWQASGGIAELADLRALKQIGIGGIIIGKALLTGRFDIDSALRCWQNA